MVFLVVPGAGRVSLTRPEDVEVFPADATTLSDPESVAACVERGLLVSSFEPFPLPSDCIDCGIGDEGRFVVPFIIDRERQ
jgi:hypothetical protein